MDAAAPTATAPPSPGRAGAPLPTPSIPSPSPLTPNTRRRIAAAAAAAAAGSAAASSPTRSSRQGTPTRRSLSGSGNGAGGARTPLAERRKRAEAERVRNLKGWAWAAHQLNGHRAGLTLTVWLSNLYAFMAGHGRFKVLRWLDAPFVLWLQRPKNLAHQFVTHGFGQAWAPMLLVEMAYAWAYSTKHLFLTRWLLLPLAAYYWSVFNRIALAEQRLRTGKGKRISWEEYLCIYLPFALKAGFLAASACINVTAMVTVDYAAPLWLQLTVAWGTQLALFLLGAYAIRAHDCHVTLGWILWGLNGQPRPVPHFTSLPTSLLIGGRVLKSLRSWVHTAAAAPTPEALKAASPLAAASPRLHQATKELDARLLGLESRVAHAFDALITGVHYIQIHIYTHLTALPSTPGFKFTTPRTPASVFPTQFFSLRRAPKAADKKEEESNTKPPATKKTLTESNEALSASTTPAIATPAAVTGAGNHTGSDEKQEFKAAEPAVVDADVAEKEGLRKLALPSAGLPLYLLYALAAPALLLLLSFLLGASLAPLLAPPQASLTLGAKLHVGESLKYRCTLADYWTAPGGCRDLDLVLTNDGALSLYRDRQRTDAALVWRSPLPSALPKKSQHQKKKHFWEHIPLPPHFPHPGKQQHKHEEEQEQEQEELFVPRFSDRYVAHVDARARLVVSLGEEVIYRTPRLVADANRNAREAPNPSLAIDGVLGSLYLMTAEGPEAATEGSEHNGEPTFVSSW